MEGENDLYTTSGSSVCLLTKPVSNHFTVKIFDGDTPVWIFQILPNNEFFWHYDLGRVAAGHQITDVRIGIFGQLIYQEEEETELC